MNAAHHYREAERLLAGRPQDDQAMSRALEALAHLEDQPLTQETVAEMEAAARAAERAAARGPHPEEVAMAQVHATLALAAATAHGTCGISPEGKSSTELYTAVVADPEPTR